MTLLLRLTFIVLLLLSLRRIRWAYAGLVVVSLLSFGARVDFHLNPQPCELRFGLALAIHSLTNYPHIVLFGLFFLITSVQLPMTRWSSFGWATLATLIMGALVELAEGVTGKGHCRSRDLIPDAVGAMIGAVIVLLWTRMRRKAWPG